MSRYPQLQQSLRYGGGQGPPAAAPSSPRYSNHHAPAPAPGRSPQPAPGPSGALQQELDKVRAELAEMVDEVLYAEGQANAKTEELNRERAAARRAEALYCDCIENMLAYTASLETNVLGPAFGDLAKVLQDHQAAKRHRAAGITTASEATAGGVGATNPRLVSILERIRDPTATTGSAAAAAKRNSKLTAGAAGPSHHPDDAYVACEALLEANTELTLLLDDTKRKLSELSAGGGGEAKDGAATATVVQRLQERVRELEAAAQAQAQSHHQSPRPAPHRISSPTPPSHGGGGDEATLRDTIRQLQQEREGLMTQAMEAKSFEALYKQNAGDKALLQQRTDELERDLHAAREEKRQVADKFEVLHRALQLAKEEREMMQYELAKARPHSASAAGSATPHNTSSGGSQGDVQALRNDNTRLQVELDTLMRTHSQKVTALEGELAEAKERLAHSTGFGRSGSAGGTAAAAAHSNSSSSAAAYESTAAKQLQYVQQANDALRAELSRLQKRVFSSSPRRGGAADMDDSHHNTTATHPAASAGKIRAFENTIAALNAELQQVEAKITQLEEHYTQEKEQLMAQMKADRALFTAEREECDVIVQKMADEMEALFAENTALKQRLHAAGGS